MCWPAQRRAAAAAQQGAWHAHQGHVQLEQLHCTLHHVSARRRSALQRAAAGSVGRRPHQLARPEAGLPRWQRLAAGGGELLGRCSGESRGEQGAGLRRLLLALVRLSLPSQHSLRLHLQQLALELLSKGQRLHCMA